MREFGETYLTYLMGFIRYITNTGQVPLKTAHFDEDWEPIGPQLRKDLLLLGWIEESPEGITLTKKAPL